MTPLVARAPVRIDLGGGWTDVPPYCVEHGGFVCNVAISRYATVRLTASEFSEPPRLDNAATLAVPPGATDRALADAALARFGTADLRAELTCDFPSAAGLGGSSAAGVALVGALATRTGESVDPGVLAERSRMVEVEDLRIAGGRQDHYAAAYGGALALTFGATTDVRRLDLPKATIAEFERRIVLAFTGRSRISGITIQAVLDAYRSGDSRVLHALHETAELARRMADTLEHGTIDDLAPLVAEQWRHQQSLHPAITTPEIDAVIAAGKRAGCLGAKALGASGGGCVMLIATDGREGELHRAVSAIAQPIPFEIDWNGFMVMAREIGV